MAKRRTKKMGIGTVAAKGAADVTGLTIKGALHFIPDTLAPKKKRRK